MTHGRLGGGLMGVTALLVSGSLHAEGLRCGDRLASTGESLYEVRAKCGDPDDAQHNIETRSVAQKTLVPCAGANGQHFCQVVVLQTVQIAIDRWTYDFGNNRFVEFARFEDGNLVRVSTGGYGQKEPQ